MANYNIADFSPEQREEWARSLADEVFRRQEILDKQAEAVEQAAQEVKHMELKAQLLMDEMSIRRELRKMDLDRQGIFKGFMFHWEKELEFAKNAAKHKFALRKDEEYSLVLQKKIQEYEGKQDPMVVNHLKNLQAKHAIQTDINKQIAASAKNVSAFGGAVQAVGAFLNSGAGRFISGFFGTIFNVIGRVISFIWDTLGGMFTRFMEIQKLTGNIAGDMGQTEFQTQQINNNIAKIGVAALQWGVNINEALSYMTRFSEITGLNHIFLSEEVRDLAAISKATGLGVQATGEMYARMELLGYSTSQFHDYVESTRQEAGMLGLNITKVLTTVNTLLPVYNQLNFREGIKGLTELVMKAQGLRFELDNMRNLAVNVFNPEGAVELAAKLRILGGNFARIADPFNLMLKGQTDAAGLMNDVLSALAGSAVRTAEGFFTIPPVQQALLRDFAAATGESVENLTRATIQMAKQQDIMTKLQSRGMFNDKDLIAVANLAEWDATRKEYMIKVDMMGTRKAISEINSNLDIRKQLHGFVREEQQVAETRMNLLEQFRNLYDTFLFSLQPIFRPIEALFKDSRFMMQLQNTMTQLGQMIANKLIPWLGSGGNIYNIFMGIGERLAAFIGGIGRMLDEKKSLVQIIAQFIADVLKGTWAIIKPELEKVAAAVGGTGLGSGIRKTAQWGGALGGLAMGAQLGSVFGPWGLAIGAALGGLGGWLGGKYLSDKIAPAQDFIMRSDGSVMRFDKNDLVMGGTQLQPKPNETTTPMVTSRSMMQQVKTYDKKEISNVHVYVGGSSRPESINLNLGGTLQIKGEKETAYLTSADLKNVGLQQLTYSIMKEMERYNNHLSGKRLSSEVITPIRNT